jgi:hypothetical protein
MYVKDGIDCIKARYAIPVDGEPLCFRMKAPHLCQGKLACTQVLPVELAESEYSVDPATNTISVTPAADRRIRDTNMVRFGVCNYWPSN